MAEAGSIQHLLMENVPAASTVPGNEGTTLNKNKCKPSLSGAEQDMGAHKKTQR